MKELNRKGWIYWEENKNLVFLNLVSFKEIKIKKYFKEIIYLLKLLDKPSTLDKVVGEMMKRFNITPSRTKKIIKLLKNKKIIKIIDNRDKYKLDPNYLCSYDRQLDYFLQLTEKNPYSLQYRLRKSRVSILGLGSIGNWILLALISAGVGNVFCVDFDKVEKRNLGRQPLFRTEDVGKFKVHAAINEIKKIKPEIRVKGIIKKINNPNIKNLIKDSDIIVQSCDTPRFLVRRWINEACLKLRKPTLFVQGRTVGPLCIPYKTACWGCVENKIRKIFKDYDKYVDNVIKLGDIRFPEFSPDGAVAGVLAGREVILHLLGFKPLTYKGFYTIDPFNHEIKFVRLVRRKGCEFCGTRK
jgi:molybdopterin/thiamine biosynthesis adenylyltransferase